MSYNKGSWHKEMEFAHPEFRKEFRDFLVKAFKHLSTGPHITDSTHKFIEALVLQQESLKYRSHLNRWGGSLAPSADFRLRLRSIFSNLEKRIELAREYWGTKGVHNGKHMLELSENSTH